MAVVSYGPIVSDASGKVAGTVFSKWRTRSYIRRLVKPANPNTAGQQAIRNAFSLQTNRYLHMTSDLATAWDNYAKGKPFIGRNGFIAQTAEEERQAATWPCTPHNPAIFPVLTLALTPAGTQITADWTYDEKPATGKTWVYWVQLTDKEFIWGSTEKTLTDLTHIITPLTNDKLYMVWIFVESTVSGEEGFSMSKQDQDTPTA